MKQIMLFLTTILTGLSAGLFYAWAVSVIPGTRKVLDMTYLEAMQSINREILNPAFFLIFFGSLITLAIVSFQQYGSGMAFWLSLGALATYLIGTFGVTSFGNVPLNNMLEAINLQNLTAVELADFRQQYESKWNWLHMIRTVFSVISFILILLTSFIKS